MKKRFEYYRVPSTYRVPNKGRPSVIDLHRYERGKGFLMDLFNIGSPRSKGGCTICDLTINGNTYTARAFCSHSDNFCYRRGRDISLGRAMKLYNEETQ